MKTDSNNWLKTQFAKRRWTVVATFLLLLYLLALLVVLGTLNITEDIPTIPFVCQLLFSLAIYYVYNGPLLTLASAIFGLCSKDKISRIWSMGVIALDFYPLCLAARRFGQVYPLEHLFKFYGWSL